MQARLNHKDETLHKYQELLHQARDDAAAISRRYEEELKQMQAKLHDRNDAAFAKFKQAIQTEMNKPVTPAPTNKQVAHSVFSSQIWTNHSLRHPQTNR